MSYNFWPRRNTVEILYTSASMLLVYYLYKLYLESSNKIYVEQVFLTGFVQDNMHILNTLYVCYK